MKYTFILLAIFILVVLIFYPYHKNIPQNTTVAPSVSISPKPTQTVLGVVQSVSSSKCHTDGILPDPNCTPGAIDVNVTQENLFQTICVKGYTATVRPSVNYTNKLKRQQIIDYGYTDTNMRDYEEDHLISLELGGSPSDPKNLWPEPGASPNSKDKIENICHQKVCSGQISLNEAQKQISTNWPTACQ